MTQQSAQATRAINGVGEGQDSPAAPAHALEGEYVKRRRRRRLDLRSLHGTLRESARVYRELAEARISMAEAEVRSRVLKRHGEILSAYEQGEQIREIQAKLAALQGSSLTLPAIDPSPVSDLQQQLTDTEHAGDRKAVPV